MKNYNFERDLRTRIKKAQRDLEICMLYEALNNVTEVADRLNIGRTTVYRVIKSNLFVETQQGNFFALPLNQVPKQ